MASKKRHKTPNRRPVTAARTSATGTKAAGRAARKRRMSSNMKFTAALVAVVLAIGGMIWWANRDDAPDPGVAAEQLVRASSHRLSTAADGKVTLVEFLDFECESCGAAYPGVEKLRAEYRDRITYVVRLFPLPGHRNGVPAAKAVQAAANQGKFEAMYKKMFESQASWGDQQIDHTATFEGFATELGLDMTRFGVDVTAAETAAFVDAEVADGKTMKVTGTPTFFLNGEKFTGRPTYEGLKAAVDAALAA